MIWMYSARPLSLAISGGTDENERPWAFHDLVAYLYWSLGPPAGPGPHLTATSDARNFCAATSGLLRSLIHADFQSNPAWPWTSRARSSRPSPLCRFPSAYVMIRPKTEAAPSTAKIDATRNAHSSFSRVESRGCLDECLKARQLVFEDCQPRGTKVDSSEPSRIRVGLNSMDSSAELFTTSPPKCMQSNSGKRHWCQYNSNQHKKKKKRTVEMLSSPPPSCFEQQSSTSATREEKEKYQGFLLVFLFFSFSW
jgi:hypothetical protein